MGVPHDPLAYAVRRRAREAISAGRRAYALSLREHGATRAQIAAALALSRTRVGQILANAEHLAAQPRWHRQFPARALNFLIIRGLADLPENQAATVVAKFTRRELLDQPNLGRGAVGALTAWLAMHALAPRDDTTTAKKKGVPARLPSIARVVTPLRKGRAL
jgi:hypothetical protein